MSDKKFQIFVSSTYEDLKDERAAVVKTILEMGHFPVGMEMFSAGDEEQWRCIQRHIESSDYYIVIVAHRYGTTLNGISYTEREYDFAVSKGIPVLGLVLQGGVKWNPEMMETDAGARKSLDGFRAKVCTRMVDYWTDTNDLAKCAAVSLGKAFQNWSRSGWVPASQAVQPETANQLAALIKENAELKRAAEANPQQLCTLETINAELYFSTPNVTASSVLQLKIRLRIHVTGPPVIFKKGRIHAVVRGPFGKEVHFAGLNRRVIEGDADSNGDEITVKGECTIDFDEAVSSAGLGSDRVPAALRTALLLPGRSSCTDEVFLKCIPQGGLRSRLPRWNFGLH